MTSKTKHLDTAIEILGGGKAKRAPRKFDVTITVTHSGNDYILQNNGKVVEQGDGDRDYAIARANERATRIRALGKTCAINLEE